MKTKGNADKIGAWTREENSVLAGAYLDILTRELNGERVNKAHERRQGLALMATYREDRRERSHGSWEMKMCNASAVMVAAGIPRGADLPWIQGYKPLGHGQARDLAHALAVAALAHGWNDDNIAALEALTAPKPAPDAETIGTDKPGPAEHDCRGW